MTHEEFKSVWLPLNATFYRTAWAVLGNEADAKDAVQELYVRLWNSKDKLETVLNPASYGNTIVRNISLDLIRKKNVRRGQDIDFAANCPSLEETDKRAINRETVSGLYAAMEKLPEDDRLLVQLRFFEELEYDEICRRTGLNPVNVRVRISRARQKIKAELKR